MLLATSLSAQKVRLIDGNLDGLKGVQKMNIQFDYSHMGVGKFEEEADYIKFHIDTIGCRYCNASVTDLKSQQSGAEPEVAHRRQKYFQSSVGQLRKK